MIPSRVELARGPRMGLDVVELILKVEEAFGASIDDRDAAGLQTVDALYRYLLIKLDCGPSDEGVWERLRGIVAEQAGVARDRVTPEKRFVADLGMD